MRFAMTKKATTRGRAKKVLPEAIDFLIEAHRVVIGEQEGRAHAKAIDEIRSLATRMRARYSSADEKKLVAKLRRMNVSQLHEIARAFTLLFWLMNVAEGRQLEAGRTKAESDSLKELFKRLKKAGISAIT